MRNAALREEHYLGGSILFIERFQERVDEVKTISEFAKTRPHVPFYLLHSHMISAPNTTRGGWKLVISELVISAT